MVVGGGFEFVMGVWWWDCIMMILGEYLSMG